MDLNLAYKSSQLRRWLVYALYSVVVGHFGPLNLHLYLATIDHLLAISFLVLFCFFPGNTEFI